MSQPSPLIKNGAAHLALGTAYFFMGRYRILAPHGFYKQIVAIALSAITQTTYRILTNEEDQGNPNLTHALITDLASIGVLTGGGYLAGMTKTATLFSMLFLYTSQLFIASTFLPFGKPISEPTIPLFSGSPLEEAKQIQQKMKPGNLKEKAAALIALAELRLASSKVEKYEEQIKSFSGTSYADIHYLCGAAQLLNNTAILDDAFNRFNELSQKISEAHKIIAQDKSESKQNESPVVLKSSPLYDAKELLTQVSACMVALARTHREMNPFENTERYEKMCYRTKEINYWIGDNFNPELTGKKTPLRSLEEIRVISDPYQRVEALCSRAKNNH